MRKRNVDILKSFKREINLRTRVLDNKKNYTRKIKNLKEKIYRDY